MENEIGWLKKSDYFKENENIYIHLSDNLDMNKVSHRHNFIEVSFVVSGTAIHSIEGISYPVKKGNVVIVDYNTPHTWTFDPDRDGPFLTYDLLFTPDFFNTSGMNTSEFYSLASPYLFSSLFREFDSHYALHHLIGTNAKEFHQLFEQIYREYTLREKGSQPLIRAYLVELIIKLFRELERQQPSFTLSHHKLVEQAVSFMQENYKAHINLDDIVSGVFLSKDYFRQIFKKITGTSITSYIQELRIAEACRLLETTHNSSAEIARESGFNDIKFFYQTFKKATGMTPAEYRKKHTDNSVF
jgi:AraC-like DNA-binding protein